MLWGTSWTGVLILVQFVVKIVRGLVIPRVLAPANYGLWNSLGLVLGYAHYADLGMQQQLNKRLPYQYGKEGSAGYWNLASRGTSWTICVTLAIAIALLVVSFFYQGDDAWFYQKAFRLLALAIVVQNAHALLTVLLGTLEEFRIVAISSNITEVFGLVAAVVGVLTIGVLGLVWAFLLAELVGALYCMPSLWRLGLPSLRWKLRGITVMIREGLVLLGVALLEQMMMTVDQLFILRFFPKQEFGIYSLGLFLVSVLISIAAIFLASQPRILELWGAGQKEQSRQINEASVALYVLASALCVAFFLPLTDFMVHFYLPKYTSGITVFVLMPAIAIARGPVILLRSHFLVHNRERRLIAFQACGLLSTAILDGLIIWQHWDMIWIVAASTAGYSLTGALMFFDFEREGHTMGRAKYAVLLASLAGVVAVSVFYQLRASVSSDVLRYIAETLGAALAYLLLIVTVMAVTWRSWLRSLRFYAGGAKIPFVTAFWRRLAATTRNV